MNQTAKILVFPTRCVVDIQRNWLFETAIEDGAARSKIKEILNNLMEQIDRTDAAVAAFRAGLVADSDIPNSSSGSQ